MGSIRALSPSLHGCMAHEPSPGRGRRQLWIVDVLVVVGVHFGMAHHEQLYGVEIIGLQFCEVDILWHLRIDLEEEDPAAIHHECREAMYGLESIDEVNLHQVEASILPDDLVDQFGELRSRKEISNQFQVCWDAGSTFNSVGVAAGLRWDDWGQ